MDKARKWTDAHLEEMETHIRQMYTQAQAELTEKWDAYIESSRARLDELYADYISAPPEQKAEALKRYQDAMQSFTLRNRRYHAMVAIVVYRLAHVNETAIAYINGEIPKIYVKNFNYIDPEVADIGISWTLRNEETINKTLPNKTLNRTKDMAWNSRQINNAVLQGILQGESIPKISKRLLPIVNNNKAASVRTARTMVTGAENMGRQDRYDEYEREGLIINKVWIATPDGRTRNWHLSMDGQEVKEDEPFEDGLGNLLQYPGDPSAPAKTVYNCRCSMRSHILGVRRSDGSISSIKNYRTGQTFHESQIEKELRRRR